MSDTELEAMAVAGEISLALESGTVEDKASLLRIIARLRTPEDYQMIRDSYGLNEDGTQKGD